MSLLIAYPALDLGPAALFLALFLASRRPVTGLAALAWLGYALYETAMRLRWLCTGECNILVDLLLIYPVLLLLSVLAVVGWARWVAARADRR